MIDTNILISVIMFPSKGTNEYIKRLTSGNEIVLCDYVLDEVRTVTERKFPQKLHDLERSLMEIPYELVFLRKNYNRSDYPQIRDEKDLPILVTAIDSGIDVIVSGDKDFLSLEINNPMVLTMREFVEKF